MKSTATARQSWETPWFRWPLVWAFTLGVTLLVGLLAQSGLVTPLELSTRDWRMQMRGSQPVKSRIVIIAVDEQSLKSPKLKEPMMLWGGHHADVFNILNKFGAKAIGFDVVQPIELGNYVNPNHDHDQKEAQAIAAAPQLVLTFTRTVFPDGTTRDTLPSPQFNAALALGGGLIGLDTTLPDPDGIIRRFTVDDGSGDLSFPLQLAAMATGKEPSFKGNTLHLGTLAFPLSAAKEGTIDYVGPVGTFPRISYLDLLTNPANYKSQIQGSICLIGGTAIELQDVHNVPLAAKSGAATSNLMPGIEVHANALHTLLTDSVISQSGPLATWALIALASLLAVPLSWLPRTTFVFPALVILVGFWVAVCLWAFASLHWQLPLVAVILALIGNQSLCISARMWQDGRKNRWLEEVMGRRVSPQVLEHLRNTPGSLDLGGRRQEVTVLFSDVRGFTNLSEQLDPEQVTGFLNKYLEKMVEIIFVNGGTVDKFIGDGIMVIYNWPLSQEDHARRALISAVQMQEAVAASRAEWEQMGMPPIHIGIGIHTGPAILGNIGSSQRMETTAIGDTVNVASRAEGLCKTVGKSHDSGILLSESTFHEAKAMQLSQEFHSFQVVPAGDTPVRGRRETLQLFAIKMNDLSVNESNESESPASEG